MKGRAEESSNWNLKQGRTKKRKRWWTANSDWLYLVPHSTCTPCGCIPHFHKSPGLHLTRETKKMLLLQENTKHDEYCIMLLSCRHSYVVTHDIIHSRINVLYKDSSIKHPTACSKSESRCSARQSQLSAYFLGSNEEPVSRVNAGHKWGVSLNKKTRP